MLIMKRRKRNNGRNRNAKSMKNEDNLRKGKL